jgi:DNA mismatch repair protein MutS
MSDQDLTPMMRQYHAMKQEVPDALLMFRLGDFYELFFEDAVTASRELEITLTARHKERENPVPMCGVPFHAADGYIARLLRKGFKVAICDQMEAPQKGVKIVRREITRVVTPGTITDSNVLTPGENNYLLAVTEVAETLGCAFLDISTGEFRAVEFAGPNRWNLLLLESDHFAPREVVFPDRLKTSVQVLNGIAKTNLEDWLFDADYSERILKDQMQTATLEGFGLTGRPAAVGACGAIVHYVRQTQKAALEHVNAIVYQDSASYLILDSATIRNLELFESPGGGAEGHAKDTLIGVLNRTHTGMGARLLRAWMMRPSIQAAEIESRYDAVGELAGSAVAVDAVRKSFEGIFDIERLLSKITIGTAGPRELISLRSSMGCLPHVADAISKLKAGRFGELHRRLDLLEDLHALLSRSIADDPPPTMMDGGVIRDGYDAPLDELRVLSKSGKSYLASLEIRERDRTGISSLKVRFNRVFGYYIEISNSNKHLVPADYDRKQTLVGAERYTTPELKEYEEKILTAEERILEIEKRLFQDIRTRIAAEAARIRHTASVIAELDVLSNFAGIALRFGYSRPQIAINNDELIIRQGRHPVIEALAEQQRADRFVPNDLYMNDSTDQILVITGPNMGGKSTYLRQAALLVILAQMGSFVPAHMMKFPLADRIFTRIGASDNLTRGRSTFMVEMTETALILNSATSRSLIVLDEIGRGTATFDGLSLAWAVIEHIQAKIQAKTIFATHYHELTELADLLPGIRNLHVTVKETGNRIIFLRTVEAGPADRSYGIEVARLAGIPVTVTERAREILRKHEENEHQLSDNLTVRARRKTRVMVHQLPLFTAIEEELRNSLRALDLNNLTPMDALRMLEELRKKAQS